MSTRRDRGVLSITVNSKSGFKNKIAERDVTWKFSNVLQFPASLRCFQLLFVIRLLLWGWKVLIFVVDYRILFSLRVFSLTKWSNNWTLFIPDKNLFVVLLKSKNKFAFPNWIFVSSHCCTAVLNLHFDLSPSVLESVS